MPRFPIRTGQHSSAVRVGQSADRTRAGGSASVVSIDGLECVCQPALPITSIIDDDDSPTIMDSGGGSSKKLLSTGEGKAPNQGRRTIHMAESLF